MIPTSVVLVPQVIAAECLRNRLRTKTHCFDASKCKSIDETYQDRTASSVSEFQEPGLKRKVIVSKISFLQKL